MLLGPLPAPQRALTPPQAIVAALEPPSSKPSKREKSGRSKCAIL